MTTNLTPCWNFPILNGLLTGADGGSSASNFRGDPIKSIGKENLQNPIDARQDERRPVKVEFSVFSIPSAQFPGRDDLERAINQAKATAKPIVEYNIGVHEVRDYEIDEEFFKKI